MSVEGDIAAVDIKNAGDQRSAVKVFAPVLEENIRFALGQDLDPFPDGHALFEMLFLDLTDIDRFDRALDQIMTFLHDLFIGAGLARNLSGNGEVDLLRLGQRIV